MLIPALNRHLLPALLASLALAALLVSVPAANAACPAGKATFTYKQGKKTQTLCLKTAPIKVDPADRKPATVVTQLVGRATKPVKGGKFRVPPRIKKRLPKAMRAAQKFLTTAGSGKIPSRAVKPSRGLRAAGASPVIDRMRIDSDTINLGGGVKLQMSLDALAHEDDSDDATMSMVFTAPGGERVKITPKIEWNSSPPEVPCPTAEGEVVLKETEDNSVTVTAFKGKKVTGSMTVRDVRSVVSRGHVGRDARLRDVTTTVEIDGARYERGLQTDYKLSGDVTTPREGSPAPDAISVTESRVRAAGKSAAQEAAAARDFAASFAADPATGQALGSSAASHRYRILDNEHKWYDIPNSCAMAKYDPSSIASIATGSSALVQGVVEAKDGGVAHAEFIPGAVITGAFTPVKLLSDPGSPAQFNATGGPLDENELTIDSEAIVTSTAGRTDANFYARDEGSVDITFTGHADYQRDGGNSGTTTEHHVTAAIDWSITYDGVELTSTGETVNFATANSVTGTWVDNGRHGAGSAANFSCGGPVASYVGDNAILRAQKSLIGYKVSASPFFVVQSDVAQKTCTGLGGPPFETYRADGFSPAHLAVFEFSSIDLEGGPLTLDVAPTASLPSNCTDIVGSFQTPCNQTLTWTGKVTVKKSGT